MATVTIGGRALDVQPSTLGFVKRKLLPWKRRLAESKSEEETIDVLVEGILLYVGHNEGVTADFLLDHVPDDARETLDSLRAAAGQKPAAPGEAKSP